MLFYESRNEEVPVVVAGMPAKLQRLLLLLARHLKRLAFHQFGGVVLPPGSLVLAEVAAKRLLSPWAAHRRADRRQRRQRAVPVRIAQRAHQCAVTTHRMSEDALSCPFRGEILADDLRHLLRHVAVHAVVLRPG